MDLDQYKGLMSYVVCLPDCRCLRGRRHRWDYLLTLVTAAVATGAKGADGIHQWTANHLETLYTIFGEHITVPSVSTFQRVLRGLDSACLERFLEAFQRGLPPSVNAADLAGPVLAELLPELTVLPVDGKWVRTASAHLRERGEAQDKVLLLGLSTCDGRVLRQVRVPAGTNEEGTALTLLAGLDLRGCLVTFDAGLTAKRVMRQVIAQGGDYLMAVKGNSPELLEAITAVFETPATDRRGRVQDPTREQVCTLSKAHGRLERRELTVTAQLSEWLADPPQGRRAAWPAPRLVLRRVCQRINSKTGVVGREEVTYGLCSLPPERITAALLLDCWRAHWSIENKVHHVRDVTFGEDRRRAWRGSGPQALAALTNAMMTRFRRDEHWQTRWQTMPQALMWAAADPIHALHLVGVPCTMT